MLLEQVTTLSVLMEKKSGLLSQVVRTLVKRGHTLTGQQMADADQPGHSVLSIYFKGEIELGAEDLYALKNLHPAIREVKISHPQAAASLARTFGTGKPIPEEAFFAFLVKRYPDIVHLVTEYKNTLEASRRTHTIFSLGQNLGMREYRTKYSRGNPLTLELTIKRMLQPALSSLVKLGVNENSITVPNCPFCRESINLDDWECTFLRGYIFGFLKENPKEPAAEVQQSHGMAKGDSACCFHVN